MKEQGPGALCRHFSWQGSSPFFLALQSFEEDMRGEEQKFSRIKTKLNEASGTGLLGAAKSAPLIERSKNLTTTWERQWRLHNENKTKWVMPPPNRAHRVVKCDHFANVYFQASKTTSYNVHSSCKNVQNCRVASSTESNDRAIQSSIYTMFNIYWALLFCLFPNEINQH